MGAAVGAGAGNEERVDALVAAGVDVLLIDSLTVTLKVFCSVSVKLALNILTCKSSAATWQLLQVPARWQKPVAVPLKWVSARFYLYDAYRDWCRCSADHRRC